MAVQSRQAQTLQRGDQVPTLDGFCSQQDRSLQSSILMGKQDPFHPNTQPQADPLLPKHGTKAANALPRSQLFTFALVQLVLSQECSLALLTSAILVFAQFFQ